jgi:MarR family transcriptional regulator, transcriptional regulator for hemolysin
MGTAVHTKPEALRVGEKPLAGNLSWLLAQASHVMITEMTAAFEDMGVSPRGHCLLSAAATGEFTQKELADMVGLDKTTMVVTVDDLERAGLAERVPSKSDRRARIVRVTPAGTRVVRKGQQVVADIQEDVLASLPESDRTALIGALENLVEGRLSTPTPCSRAPRRRV